MTRRPSVIESPFAGNWFQRRRNLRYLDACILDCIRRGETPYASHKMLTTALDDSDPFERALGIETGLDMRTTIRFAVFYADLGWTTGMLFARKKYDAEGIPYVIRQIPDYQRRDATSLLAPWELRILVFLVGSLIGWCWFFFTRFFLR